MIEATKRIAQAVRDGELPVDAITPDIFRNFLYTAELPDPDLLIRTSGENRISNFLLWQCAYTEFVFVPECWPDFTTEVFDRTLDEYAKRDRRFGGIRTAEST
jgi:undecaprenyl diphosphate synthase